MLSASSLFFAQSPSEPCAPDELLATGGPNRKRKTSAAAESVPKRARKRTSARHDTWSEVATTLTERVDTGRVRALLSVLPAESEEFKALARYSSVLSDTGELSVEYRYKYHRLGRRYARESFSLGSLKKNIRAALCHGRMIDIDIVNAHPAILLQICERHRWPCPLLRQYVFDRDATLARINPDDRKKAKVLILKMLFSGAPGDEHESTRFVRAFHSEHQQTMIRVWKAYPRFRTVVTEEGRSNPKASCLSLLLSFEENRILTAMSRYLVERGWEVSTLVFDGLMVYERRGVDVEAEFSAMRSRVLEDCGFVMKFERKSWDPVLLIRHGVE